MVEKGVGWVSSGTDQGSRVVCLLLWGTNSLNILYITFF